MIPYFVLFLSIFVIGHIKYNNKKYVNVWSSFIIFLFMGFRYDVGWDFRWYFPLARRIDLNSYSIFSNLTDLGTFEMYKFQYLRLEIFNKIIYKIVWFFKQPQLFIIITSFLLIYFIKKGLDNEKIYSPYTWFLFLGFPTFFFSFLSIIRQSMAVAVIFYAYKYVKKKQLKKFLFFIFIASLFHSSAIFAFFLYFLDKIKLSGKKLVVVMFSSFFSMGLIKVFLSLSIFNSYRSYIEKAIGSGGRIIYFLIILIAFFLIFLQKKLIDKDIKNNLLINSFLFGAYIYIALMQLGDIGPRIALYYCFYILYLIDDILNVFKEKKMVKFIYLLLILFMMLLSIMGDKKNPIRSQFTPYRINLFEYRKNVYDL